ncbi:hypothetical protein ACJX0J_039121 [Zea mays]
MTEITKKVAIAIHLLIVFPSDIWKELICIALMLDSVETTVPLPHGPHLMIIFGRRKSSNTTPSSSPLKNILKGQYRGVLSPISIHDIYYKDMKLNWLIKHYENYLLNFKLNFLVKEMNGWTGIMNASEDGTYRYAKNKKTLFLDIFATNLNWRDIREQLHSVSFSRDRITCHICVCTTPSSSPLKNVSSHLLFKIHKGQGPI